MAQTHSVTPLRQRMLDDMKLRNIAVSTRKIYVSSVAGFSAYHGRWPDQLTLEDVRDYPIDETVTEKSLQPNVNALAINRLQLRRRHQTACRQILEDRKIPRREGDRGLRLAALQTIS